MRGERLLLRVGGYLVDRAAGRLPLATRDERRREWLAELPVILRDPEVRLAPRRAARMLGYALDTIRGTALATGQGRRPGTHRCPDTLGPVRLISAVVLSVISLAAFVLFWYTQVAGTQLETEAALWVLGVANVSVFRIQRRHMESHVGWPTAIAVLVPSCEIPLIFAGRYHWVAPNVLHTLTLVSYGLETAVLICATVAVVIKVRSVVAHRWRRSST